MAVECRSSVAVAKVAVAVAKIAVAKIAAITMRKSSKWTATAVTKW